MDWQEQLKSFKEGAEAALAIPVIEPPCAYCKHWKPQRTYKTLNGGSQQYSDITPDNDFQSFKGVRLCWGLEKLHDFNCFKGKDE